MGCLGAYFMKWHLEEKKWSMDRTSNDHGHSSAEGAPVKWAFCFYPVVLPGNVDKMLLSYCQSNISLWSTSHILYNTASVHFIGGGVSYVCPANPPVFLWQCWYLFNHAGSTKETRNWWRKEKSDGKTRLEGFVDWPVINHEGELDKAVSLVSPRHATDSLILTKLAALGS